MIKPANLLPKKITEEQIIDFLETCIMSRIEEDNDKGYLEACVSGLSISVNPLTGEMKQGLQSNWEWKSIRDYRSEISRDFTNHGYRVYDKNNNGCVWIRWA